MRVHASAFEIGMVSLVACTMAGTARSVSLAGRGRSRSAVIRAMLAAFSGSTEALPQAVAAAKNAGDGH